MARPGLIASQPFEMELVKAMLLGASIREMMDRFGVSRHAIDRYKKTDRCKALTLDHSSAQKFPSVREISEVVSRNPRVPQPDTIFGHDQERYRALQKLRERLEGIGGSPTEDAVTTPLLIALNKYEDEFSKLLLDMTGSAENIRAGYIIALADHYRGQFNDSLFAEDEE